MFMYIDANIFLFRAQNVNLDSLRRVHVLVYIALLRDILYLLEYTGWASLIYSAVFYGSCIIHYVYE